MNNQDVIYSINGPVVKVRNTKSFSMMEMVYVGKKKLMGEVISVSRDETTIQVYEETSMLQPGEPVEGTGEPISLTLGPGILKNIYDGIERPLQAIRESSGAFIPTGSAVDPLDVKKLWDVTLTVKPGDHLVGGDVYATVPETGLITHKLMVPPYMKGTVKSVKENGMYRIHDTVVVLETEDGDKELTLCQKWPIKTSRPVNKRLPISMPLVTGQRVLDTLFPIAKGGAAAIPGGFGTGKTMTQHQIAKWCDADIIVYIGCGERGNEMTQVLEEFQELIDPKSGHPLVDRTVLIANTSNMPVAAREASIYTGVTLAEYYRDMGYHVAIMADSTSRWAEALREISGRLEEMPAEEGFPAYLPSRLAQFYERAGYVENLNGTNGSVTIIGAVSPQGGDFSEPVTQNTKRFVRTFWALDKALAYARHYFAINWTQSYSEYIPDVERWYAKNVDPEFMRDRQELQRILAEEARLMEIVQLMGSDVLPDDQKLMIEIARVVRVGYLQQNAFHKDDTFVPLEKQFKMMEVILYLYKKAKEVVDEGKPIREVVETGIFDEVTKMKYDVPNDNLALFDNYYTKIDKICASIE
ncbi:V-type ATP synthase subunit A [Sharpea azabuensis]|uniref:V-type ATP synthase alpha chain n=1 Tax=Sharpea azabuensis TaxID=322505 RepID=A0A1H6QW84_9FIRM|nr:V-type ATP synthase subunit A [Sharpea azabuensis]HBZ50858.1 V-type ATP synthase subunit A [Erysipelotrichaceae bacterium]MDD6513242.1 V-type ATP synthase subunit A [Sharpea azabuensis]SEI47803.1 V/A-type H+-transporting ATPase subunit A [Sharpea azabuensis]SFD65264.1 V/A-type H+-transporting ATPase subunit A [Sharpea azabuensis]SFK65461.1 V/A-type H+-transporting ATPase subunit A [Sharpea azabuensis]